MEIELSEEREIIDSDLNMSFKSYLKEISTYGYNDEQYYQIAVYQLRLKQIKELKYLLVALINKLKWTNDQNRCPEKIKETRAHAHREHERASRHVQYQ
jgi:hypothetical protein